MFNIANEIDALTNFKRHIKEASAKSDQDETVAAIRAGLADVEAGRTKRARVALKALANKHGIAIGNA